MRVLLLFSILTAALLPSAANAQGWWHSLFQPGWEREVDAGIQICRDRFGVANPETPFKQLMIGHGTAYYQCYDNAMLPYLNKHPYPDIWRFASSARLAIAKDFDAQRISREEATRRLDEMVFRAQSEHQTRDAANQPVYVPPRSCTSNVIGSSIFTNCF